MPPIDDPDRSGGGMPYALGAYILWGLFPLYLMLVRSIPPIELVGWRVLFTVPVCLLIAVDSWNFFLISYQTGEASSNPGGLIWWPIKLAIPVAFILLSLQGLSETIKNIAGLTGHRPMPHFKGGH